MHRVYAWLGSDSLNAPHCLCNAPKSVTDFQHGSSTLEFGNSILIRGIGPINAMPMQWDVGVDQ